MYTKEQLMPKRYPQERPEHGYTDLWALVDIGDIKGWGKFRYSKASQSFPVVDNIIVCFIDIPNAPDEVKPLAYPENKPSKERVNYITHFVRNDVWGISQFVFGCSEYNPDRWVTNLEKLNITYGEEIDYFIDIPLEREGYTIAKPKPEIAPCPFCGGECEVFWDAEDVPPVGVVECERCGYRARFAETTAEAIRFHNLTAGRE